MGRLCGPSLPKRCETVRLKLEENSLFLVEGDWLEDNISIECKPAKYMYNEIHRGRLPGT